MDSGSDYVTGNPLNYAHSYLPTSLLTSPGVKELSYVDFSLTLVTQ